jgi:uncharacterized membrane protein
MTLQSYQRVKLITVVLVSFSISMSITMRNFYVPVIVTIIASLVLLQLRKSVKEIIADERDYEVAGKSALLAIRVFGWISLIPIFALYAFREQNPAYEAIGMTLAFSICILMLLYAVIFRFYHKITFSDKKTLYAVLVLIGFLIFAIATLRVFSGEDNWMCQNGQWVQHGHPDFPAPQIECK